MGILQKLGSGQGYLKAGFLGFPKSGKSYTSTLLSIATMKHFGLKGPLALYDTEGGSEYIAKMIKTLTGKQPVGCRSRSFDDLMTVAKECEKDGIQVLIVDSITHPWRELCEAYLKNVNAKRKQRGQKPRTRLEFQDWNPIKQEWGKWTQFYLNAKMHIVICGRAGYEYDFERDEETGRKELIKSGIKMKTETEFGFEPSLLMQMLREQVGNGKSFKLVHRAVVLGDRFGVLDGDTAEFKGLKDINKELAAVTKFFKPHLDQLKPEAHAPIDTEVKTGLDVDEEGNAEWHREQRERTIYAEEIKGLLTKAYPGQKSENKVKKGDLLEYAFDTRSWTKVENLHSKQLKEGLETIRTVISEEFEKSLEAKDGEEKEQD